MLSMSGGFLIGIVLSIWAIKRILDKGFGFGRFKVTIVEDLKK